MSCGDRGVAAQCSRVNVCHSLVVSRPGRGERWPHLFQIHVLRTTHQDWELAATSLAQRDHHNEVVPVEEVWWYVSLVHVAPTTPHPGLGPHAFC